MAVIKITNLTCFSDKSGSLHHGNLLIEGDNGYFVLVNIH